MAKPQQDTVYLTSFDKIKAGGSVNSFSFCNVEA